MNGRVVSVGLLFAFGILLGNKFASPGTEVMKVPDTHYITKTETVNHAYVPQSCLDAFKYANQIITIEGKMQATGDVQHDILSDARVALNLGGDLAKIENRQYKLDNKQIDLQGDAQQLQIVYNLKAADCRRETK